MQSINLLLLVAAFLLQLLLLVSGNNSCQFAIAKRLVPKIAPIANTVWKFHTVRAGCVAPLLCKPWFGKTI
jgi:hypothetical protein